MLIQKVARRKAAWSGTALRGLVLSGLFVALSLMGCSKQIPVAELVQYRAAFAEVHAVSEQILIDFAEAKAIAEASQDSRGVPAYGPHRFDGALRDPGSWQPPAVSVRRLSLRTINEYNNALLMLAEGKGADSVRAATGRFVDALGKLIDAGGGSVPGLSAISSLAQTLAEQVEKARTRAEFEKAVRDGAPIVQKILDSLIAERQDHMDLRLAETNLRQVEILDEIATGVRGIRALVGTRVGPPMDGDEVRGEVQDALNAALEPGRIYPPIELAFGPDGDGLSEFSEADRVLVDEMVLRISKGVEAYLANIAQFEALRNALDGYGEMLENTGSMLDALVLALDRPRDFDDTAEELFEIAFGVKRDIEAIRSARNAAAN